MSAPIASKLVTKPLTADSVLVLEAARSDGVAPIVLTPGEWSFGSGSQCRVVLAQSDADEVHAQISVSADEVVICAWGRGVRVNGAEIDDAVLSSGDRLEIGAAAFMVRRACAEEIIESARKTPAPAAESARSPSSDGLLSRISVIAETLDSLERELRGEEHACDRLDQVIERIQNNLANGSKSSRALPAESRRDESLRTIREQLDGLVSSLHAEMKTPLESQSAALTLSAERSQSERLDEVIARVQPGENITEDWASQQTAVATRMTTHLSRLLDFSQQLCARAAVLDEEAVDLYSQWDDLRQQREELSLQRDLLHEETERFSQRVEIWQGVGSEAPQLANAAVANLAAVAAAPSNEPGDVLPCGFDGDGGGQRDRRSRETFASANWNLDGESLDDWSVTAIGRPAAAVAVDSDQHARSFERSGHEDEFSVCERHSENDSHGASAGGAADFGPETIRESFADDEGVECIDSVTDSEVTVAIAEESDAGEETLVESQFDARAASQVGELQRLVHEIEVEVDHDGNDDTIDELPVGSLLSATLDHDSEVSAVEIVGATTSRDAAVAELDALLAAYAHEDEGAPIESEVDIEFDDSVASVSDESTLELADSQAEGTLDLSSGETWYESQPLETADEFLSEPERPLAADVSDEQPSSAGDSWRDLDDQAAHAEQLLDALRHDEQSLVEQSEDVDLSSTTEGTHEVDVIVADGVALSDAGMLAPNFSVDVDDDLSDCDTQGRRLFSLESESAVEIPTGSLLAQLERQPTENSEEAKLNDLRSQLADLFGMKPTASVRPELLNEKPLDERFESFFTGGKSVEELDQQGALTEATDSVASEVEAVDNEIESTTADNKSEAQELAEPSNSESIDADDSIRAYMAQLIARNKQVGQGGRTDEKTDKREEGISTIEGYSTLAFEALPEKKSAEQDYSYLSEGPKHKQDKDAVRASMTQLRQLANMQARTAVVRAGRKQLKLQVLAKLAGTVMSFAFGATAIVLQLPAVYGYVVCGLGMFFACDLCLSVVRNWKLLAKQGKLVRESNDAEQSELKVDPRTEGRLDQFTKASRQ